ncbi:MAG TPA: helix-turn-helix transcriptional regulator [Burkholderiaceae bacterium]
MRSSADLERIPRPVVALSDEYPSGFVDPRHHHERGQLLYATAGVMSVVTDEGSFVVPPLRAVWIPAGVEHEVACRSAVSLRTLYVQAGEPGLPARCRVIEVSELLRALILEMMRVEPEYDEAGREGLVARLLVATIAVAPVAPLHARMPDDARIARICRQILQEPARGDSLDDWAASVAMSRRTLTRLFRQQTGMSLASWRQHVRLMEAVARLACGHPVTAIAYDIGYDSPSAFTAVFQRTFGTSPSRYLS